VESIDVKLIITLISLVIVSIILNISYAEVQKTESNFQEEVKTWLGVAGTPATIIVAFTIFELEREKCKKETTRRG
jgi:hypothetical protein